MNRSVGATAGALGALGWEYRGEGGLTFGVELSAAYEPGASEFLSETGGPVHVGGALLLGFSR